MIKRKAKVNIFMLMGLNTQDNGNSINSTELAQKLGQMGHAMLESIIMFIKVVRVRQLIIL